MSMQVTPWRDEGWSKLPTCEIDAVLWEVAPLLTLKVLSTATAIGRPRPKRRWLQPLLWGSIVGLDEVTDGLHDVAQENYGVVIANGKEGLRRLPNVKPGMHLGVASGKPYLKC
jgi:hypothetical protein